MTKSKKITKTAYKKPDIVAIVGPTALGKSDLAIFLAKKINGEIISADSRQVYKGMNLGTGKVTTKEMKGVKHYMLDIADPQKRISVEQYKKLAEKAIKEILNKGKTPIICGGTGFYIDELLFPSLLPKVKPNKKLRKNLDKLSTEKLFLLLKQKDNRRANEIDPKNKVRLIRALEIIEKLGKVPERTKRDNPYNVFFIKLDAPMDVLRANIHKRLLKRIKLGMLNEACRLNRKGLSLKAMESFGLEYKWMARFLNKKINKKEFFIGLENDIVKYARRQKTWFKKY